MSNRSKFFLLFIFLITAALGTAAIWIGWRLSQEEEVTPTPSEAADACCCSGCDNICSNQPNTAGCGPTAPGGYCDPNGDGNFSDADWTRGYNEYQGLDCSDQSTTADTTSTGYCRSGHDCAACEYPLIAYCTTIAEENGGDSQCRCRTWDNQPYNGCSGPATPCEPGACPGGYSSCGISGSHDGDSGCQAVASTRCNTSCPGCNNGTYVLRYCRLQQAQTTTQGTTAQSTTQGTTTQGTTTGNTTARTTTYRTTSGQTTQRTTSNATTTNATSTNATSTNATTTGNTTSTTTLPGTGILDEAGKATVVALLFIMAGVASYMFNIGDRYLQPIWLGAKKLYSIPITIAETTKETLGKFKKNIREQLWLKTKATDKQRLEHNLLKKQTSKKKEK